MRYLAVRRAERYLGLAMLAGMSTAAGAQELQTSVAVSTGASVETNPYNETNAGNASIAATATIEPSALWRGERSTIELNGLASFRQFFRRYGLENSYGVNGAINTRVSERLTVSSNAGFNSSQGGFNNFARRGLQLGAPTVDLPPGEDLPDPVLIDPTVLGSQTRTNAFNFGVGASTKLNTYSDVSLSASGRSLRFNERGFGDFNTISGQASYSHQLSETLSVGASGSVSRSDYLRTPVGDARTISIQGTVNYRLGAAWTLSGSAGMAFTSSARPFGLSDRKFNSFTMQGSFCRQAEYSRFCLNASRSPEPSAEGNVRITNVIQADYTLRLSGRENVSLSGSYARTERSWTMLTSVPKVEFFSGGIRYDRQLRSNLTFYTGANTSKINSQGSSRRMNFGVNAGIQYRFGALQ